MQTLLIIAMTPIWLIGLLVFWYVAKPIKQRYELSTGFDVSNRINRIRALWFTLREPWLLVELWPWLKLDEGDKND